MGSDVRKSSEPVQKDGRKQGGGNGREDVRLTISFARVVVELMESQMELRGFNNNASAYLADLVRRDRERTIDLARAEEAYLKTPPPNRQR